MTTSLIDEKGNSAPSPGRYRHFKGNEYQVIDTVTHSETEQLFVLYRPLYGEGKLWIRPLELFNRPAEIDGKRVPRFSRIDEGA